MELESFPHPFFDIEMEAIDVSIDARLVKILSIDGRRFTYELRGVLTDDAIVYIKSLMDAAVFSDMVIEHSPEGWQARQSNTRLKKHS